MLFLLLPSAFATGTTCNLDISLVQDGYDVLVYMDTAEDLSFFSFYIDYSSDSYDISYEDDFEFNTISWTSDGHYYSGIQLANPISSGSDQLVATLTFDDLEDSVGVSAVSATTSSTEDDCGDVVSIDDLVLVSVEEEYYGYGDSEDPWVEEESSLEGGSFYCSDYEFDPTELVEYDLIYDSDTLEPYESGSEGSGRYLLKLSDFDYTYQDHFNYYNLDCVQVENIVTDEIYLVEYTGPCQSYNYIFVDGGLEINLAYELSDSCYGQTDYLDVRGDLYNLDLDGDEETTVQDLMVYLAWYMSPFGDGYPLVVYGESS